MLLSKPIHKNDSTHGSKYRNLNLIPQTKVLIYGFQRAILSERRLRIDSFSCVLNGFIKSLKAHFLSLFLIRSAPMLMNKDTNMKFLTFVVFVLIRNQTRILSICDSQGTSYGGSAL